MKAWSRLAQPSLPSHHHYLDESKMGLRVPLLSSQWQRRISPPTPPTPVLRLLIGIPDT